jgi:hypothetical protein
MTASVCVGNCHVCPALAIPSADCVKYQLTVNVWSPGVSGGLECTPIGLDDGWEAAEVRGFPVPLTVLRFRRSRQSAVRVAEVAVCGEVVHDGAVGERDGAADLIGDAADSGAS